MGKPTLGKVLLLYALSRWDTLTRYLGDAGCRSTATYLAERQLRDRPDQREGSVRRQPCRRGQRAALLYAIAEAAKLNGLGPEAWSAAILDRLARGHPAGRIGELLYPGTSGQSVKPWQRADAYGGVRQAADHPPRDGVPGMTAAVPPWPPPPDPTTALVAAAAARAAPSSHGRSQAAARAA